MRLLKSMKYKPIKIAKINIAKVCFGFQIRYAPLLINNRSKLMDCTGLARSQSAIPEPWKIQYVISISTANKGG